MSKIKIQAKKLLNYFLQGLLYIAPAGVLLYILIAFFTFIVEATNKSVNWLFGIQIPGLGLLIFLVLIILAGMLGSTVIARPFRILFHLLLEKIPLLKTFYSALKDFFSAFMGKEKKFHNPVLVKLYENSELQMIGFVTQKDLSKLGIPDTQKVAVYFPYSFSFMGTVAIVPCTQITPLSISAAEALKFAVSGGIIDINEITSGKGSAEEEKENA